MADLSPTQERRPFRLRTVWGRDALLLTGFSGEERLSHLFDFSVDAVIPLHQEEQHHPADLLASTATIAMDAASLANKTAAEVRVPVRHLNGIVAEADRVGEDEQFAHYRLRLVPRPYVMTMNAVCRVFHDQTVVEIVEQIFRSYDSRFFADFEYDLRAVSKERCFRFDYCVQYEESDFDFISRLLEEEGIYYYFEHEAERHRMIFADSPASEHRAAVRLPLSRTNRRNERCVFDWSMANRMRPVQFSVRDQFFQHVPRQANGASAQCGPHVELGAEPMRLDWSAGLGMRSGSCAEFTDARLSSRFESNRRGGDEGISGLAKRKVHDRSERSAVEAAVVSAKSNDERLQPGMSLELVGTAKSAGRYLIERVRHQVLLPAYVASDATEQPYQNEIACIPAQLAYRPERRTRRPIFAGLQTATVVGSTGDENSDDEIHTDHFGRVKVRFHWMEPGMSTCWLRVVQSSAGQGWGSFMLPRQGQEVAVAFRNGDLDAPFVLGSLYNAEQSVPFDLPAERTLSGYRSHTRGGSAHQSSQLLFNDQPGGEYVHLHSEGDLHAVAQNNSYFNVGDYYQFQIGSSVDDVSARLPAVDSGAGGSTDGSDDDGSSTTTSSDSFISQLTPAQQQKLAAIEAAAKKADATVKGIKTKMATDGGVKGKIAGIEKKAEGKIGGIKEGIDAKIEGLKGMIGHIKGDMITKVDGSTKIITKGGYLQFTDGAVVKSEKDTQIYNHGYFKVNTHGYSQVVVFGASTSTVLGGVANTIVGGSATTIVGAASSMINLAGASCNLGLSAATFSLSLNYCGINPLKTRIESITTNLQTVNAVLGVSNTKVGATDTTVDAKKSEINAIRSAVGLTTIV